ncbi:unnamed protein product [Durusdinium trenchii]|uniref:Transmembrane protein 65 n=2 Tax=Durusdinium trenchii TaxID=1381693 RepID=A0ABP0HXQ7_9DINO
MMHFAKFCRALARGTRQVRNFADHHGAPMPDQLRAHALQNAVPMVGFGIVDCVVMTQVGSTMDAVLGATLGISSITAAAIGLFCSDSCGVLFGGTIESFAGKLGLPAAHLKVEQLDLPVTKKWGTMGRLFGVQLGVLLGSTTLLLKTDDAKSQGKTDDAMHGAEPTSGASFETLISTDTHRTSDVVVFANPGCPSGRAVVDTLLNHQASFVVAPLEGHLAEVKKATGAAASPSIWVHGRYVGNTLHGSAVSDLFASKEC